MLKIVRSASSNDATSDRMSFSSLNSSVKWYLFLMNNRLVKDPRFVVVVFLIHSTLPGTREKKVFVSIIALCAQWFREN